MFRFASLLFLFTAFCFSCSTPNENSHTTNPAKKYYTETWRRYNCGDTTLLVIDTIHWEDSNYLPLGKIRIRKSQLDSAIDYPNIPQGKILVRKSHQVNCNGGWNEIYEITTNDLDFEIGAITYSKKYGIITRKVEARTWDRKMSITFWGENRHLKFTDLNPLGFAILNDTILTLRTPLPPTQ